MINLQVIIYKVRDHENKTPHLDLLAETDYHMDILNFRFF